MFRYICHSASTTLLALHVFVNQLLFVIQSCLLADAELSEINAPKYCVPCMFTRESIVQILHSARMILFPG